jgi:CheY-like chemotaxis protein
MDLQMPETDGLDALETIRGTEGSAFADGSARPAHDRPRQNSNKDIAGHLNITEEIIKGQVRNILAKLGAKDRTRAAVLDITRGIIS